MIDKDDYFHGKFDHCEDTNNHLLAVFFQNQKFSEKITQGFILHE